MPLCFHDAYAKSYNTTPPHPLLSMYISINYATLHFINTTNMHRPLLNFSFTAPSPLEKHVRCFDTQTHIKCECNEVGKRDFVGGFELG